MIYICGGAPPRASELEVLLVRNRRTAKRGIYIHSGNIVISPGYFKQQSQVQEAFKPVLRFLDSKSSTYYKMFAVFVRPMMESLLGAGAGGQDLFSMRQGESYMANIIGRQMKAHGLNLSIQPYRQWISGYAKRRCPELNAAALAAARQNAEKRC